MLLSWLGPVALAWTPEALQARLDAVQQHDSLRLSTMHPGVPADAVRTLSKGQIAIGLKDVAGKSAKIAWGVAVLDVPIATLLRRFDDQFRRAGRFGTPLLHRRDLEDFLRASALNCRP